MPKTKKEGTTTDWSSTGTFLRKPQTGWLHDDRELRDGSAINYQLKYLGCVEVKQSMRTLQYHVRTQVTKESITRMTELSNSSQQAKRRKVPKQINKLLGATDTRWAGDVNLAVSVEHLKISNAAGREIMNHSLPSISFASGGDGPTIDFIGYVAKDPLHERACHVFEAPGSSQYVLTTIGQAFELRYKLYLKSPKATPVHVAENLDGEGWGPTHHYEEGGGGDLAQVPLPTAGAGIYSDLPEFPNSDYPTSPPSSARPRVYSKLPGFPSEDLYDNGPAQPRLENPYDTMGGTRPSMQFSDAGVYSNPGEVTKSAEEGVYDNKLRTIRQQSTGDSRHLIELTPASGHPPPVPEHHYGNMEGGKEAAAVYDNHTVEQHRARKSNTYDDPHVLGRLRLMQRTPAGEYDNPGDIMQTTQQREYDNPGDIMQTAQQREYDNPDSVLEELGREGAGNVYDNPNDTNAYDDGVSKRSRNVYDNQEAITGHHKYETPHSSGASFRWSATTAPKFDDTIYAVRKGGRPSSEDEPLHQQQYFHRNISREEAEAMLEGDGDFLIRESKKKPGQFVLTGMSHGHPQHLLLMDKQGKVKSKDHEFESVPHLVHYFMGKKIPLVIGSSVVYLQKPVFNAIPTSQYR